MCLSHVKEMIKMAEKRRMSELSKDELEAFGSRINEVMSDEFSISASSIRMFWECLDTGVAKCQENKSH